MIFTDQTVVIQQKLIRRRTNSCRFECLHGFSVSFPPLTAASCAEAEVMEVSVACRQTVEFSEELTMKRLAGAAL